MSTLYAAPLGEHLVFKGGTSLSKAYQVIHRFSEDVDLTYDIRGLPPEKWSFLRYGFWPFGGLLDAEEEARA